MSNIEKKTEKLLQNKINELGYELYDVEYLKEGKNFFLKIYIDKEQGINIDDCECVSNAVTEILDKEDYIQEQYFLEVSSPRNRKSFKKR